MSENRQPEKMSPQELIAFAEEWLIPVIRYTADKRNYIQKHSEESDEMGVDDFDEWAKSRAKMSVAKLDELYLAATGKGVEGE